MSDTTPTTDQILATLNELGTTLAGWPDDATMASYVSEIQQDLSSADAGAEAALTNATYTENQLHDATSYAETAGVEASNAQRLVNEAQEKMEALGQRISALSEIRATVLETISGLTEQVSVLSPPRFVLSDSEANTLLDICEGVLGRDNVRLLVGVLQMTLTHRVEQEHGEEADPIEGAIMDHIRQPEYVTQRSPIGSLHDGEVVLVRVDHRPDEQPAEPAAPTNGAEDLDVLRGL